MLKCNLLREAASLKGPCVVSLQLCAILEGGRAAGHADQGVFA